MPKYLKHHTFNAPIHLVFTRFTNAIFLELNQKSNTFNTSYAQPIGTEFQSAEASFGRTIQYTIKITSYDKPHHMTYTILQGSKLIKVSFTFTEKEDKTTVSSSIILEKANIFQRFPKGIFWKKIERAIDGFIDYTEKTIPTK